MPWFGENSARLGEIVAAVGGARFPVVGSVGRTSGGLSAELEQPAVTMTAMAAAAISLFMSSLLGILFAKYQYGRIPSPCRTMRRTCRIGAVAYAWALKGSKRRACGSQALAKVKNSGKTRGIVRGNDAPGGAR